MFFQASPEALVKLRKALKEAGYDEQERQITYAIKREETRHLLSEQNVIHGRIATFFQGLFSFVFFELTTGWGMIPGRALLILVALIPFFSIFYIIVLHKPSGSSGIWQEGADNRVQKELGLDKPVRLKLDFSRAAVIGLYFSVLSAFNIGWREFNVGNWIQRLQAKDYALRPTGWVRTISGIQSLISVYLVAIWALTYFGRPFD